MLKGVRIIIVKKYLVLITCLVSLAIVGCSSAGQIRSASPQNIAVIMYEADTNAVITKEIMSSVMDTLSTRFQSLGFETITMERIGDAQVRVELKPGKSDIKQIAELVGQPDKLKLIGPNNEVIVTEWDIKSAAPSKNETYKTFDVQFSAGGTAKLAAATQRLIGQRVSIYLDDKQLASLVVTQPIQNGAIEVPGSSTVEEAKTLAAILNSGKTLPFPLKVIDPS